MGYTCNLSILGLGGWGQGSGMDMVVYIPVTPAKQEEQDLKTCLVGASLLGQQETLSKQAQWDRPVGKGVCHVSLVRSPESTYR